MASPALLAAHGAKMDRLRAHAALVAARIWFALPHYTEDVVPQWYEQIGPVVTGAQHATVQIADAFFAASLLDQATGIDPVAAVARGAGKTFEALYRKPFLTTWHQVSVGTPFPEAVQLGGKKVAGLVTEDIGRAELGATDIAVEERSYVQAYRRVVSGARTCNFCYDVAGNTYSTGDLAPLHAHCVPAGSWVWSPELARVQAMTRRWYDGDLAVMTMASGDEVSVTPNHPVLTQQGWIPADLVCVGDDLFSHTRAQREGWRRPNEQERPSRVDDLWRSLSMVGALRRVPLASEDFHGDGSNGEVDVVRPYGDLASVGHAQHIEPIRQLAFMPRHATGLSLPRHGTSLLLDGGMGATTSGCVGCGALSLSLVACHAGSSHDSGPPSPSRFDAPFGEFSLESAPVYASRGMDLVRRLARDVATDRVVKTSRIGFRGHVYNLHTAEGWYASGRHIVSNCDCGVELLPDREYVKARPGAAARNVGERIDRDGNVVTKLSAKEEAGRKRQGALGD